MDFFRLLGLRRKYRLDEAAIEEGFRKVSMQVHPDRFASASPAMRRAAEQWATRANEARDTLLDPLSRAVYMCESAGAKIDAENNTRMSVDFLMRQMDWRERLESSDAAGLEALAREVGSERSSTIDEIASALDGEAGAEAAVTPVRRLMFIDKVAREIKSRQAARDLKA